jgi:hypothetical protein
LTASIAHGAMSPSFLSSMKKQSLLLTKRFPIALSIFCFQMPCVGLSIAGHKSHTAFRSGYDLPSIQFTSSEKFRNRLIKPSIFARVQAAVKLEPILPSLILSWFFFLQFPDFTRKSVHVASKPFSLP